MTGWKKQLRNGVLLLGLLLALLIVYSNWLVLSYGHGIKYEIRDIPSRPVALIFGGGMKNVAEMSEMQEDRVLEGVTLYKTGKARKLLMTGDGGGMNADEVSAMRALAIQHGVADVDITLDGHGYRTLESCKRAKQELGIEQALAVSQSFHLPRIVYLCQAFGVTIVPVAADLREYEDAVWAKTGREFLARVKAVVEIEFLGKGSK